MFDLRDIAYERIIAEKKKRLTIKEVNSLLRMIALDKSKTKMIMKELERQGKISRNSRSIYIR